MIKKPQDLKEKRITIMGLGLNQGGLGVARFLAKAGAKILVTDLKTKEELAPSLEKLKDFNIKYILGRHRKEDFINTDMIIQNPAVPHSSKYLKIARTRGIPIETDLGLFFQLCPSKKIIAIAGTKGKSTVSQLIYHIFKEAQKDTILAGNIGISVLDILDKITPQTWLILEISTWQMEGVKNRKFRPQTAVLTNILPDHLDRYPNYKEYARSEKLIFKHQSPNDNLVVNYDNEETIKIKKETGLPIYWFSAKEKLEPGCYLENDKLVFQSGEYKTTFAKISDLPLPGPHNLENILTASTVGFIYNIPSKIILKALKNFPGVPYRLEFIGEFGGIKFYNDTCATTPEATLAALESFPKQPIILILGGKDKKLNYENFGKAIGQNKKVKKIILLQHPAYDASLKILSALKKHLDSEKIIQTSNLKVGFKIALKQAQQNDLILLSPAAASFGMFKNEFDRGDQFNKIVKNLK
ncbi:MAG TPA: UDP-N-acetylmuramoyl-L-alanine--D-glutamate ligase [Candidatus Atribacteria bacterium]|jgi:UDP-N-acetylmuramoylalanine--D-glutamate ligase|nr:UDP-N-acetylmuramoyl-L-alanine--D-glutamate ligase [Candidatus Atribacteria bacterium]